MLIIQTAAFFDNVLEPDSHQEVANYLEKNSTEQDFIFVSNCEPIIYYLLERETPSKYVHANLLFTDLHEVFRFDNLKEIQRIMDRNPRYVLVQYENKIVEAIISNRYVLDRTFRNNEILLYQLKR